MQLLVLLASLLKADLLEETYRLGALFTLPSRTLWRCDWVIVITGYKVRRGGTCILMPKFTAVGADARVLADAMMMCVLVASTAAKGGRLDVTLTGAFTGAASKDTMKVPSLLGTQDLMVPNATSSLRRTRGESWTPFGGSAT